MEKFYDDYEEDDDNRTYEKKYFCFDLDRLKLDGDLAFYTSDNPEYVDDCPPGSVYEELDELLGKHVSNLSVGAAENLHMIDDCPPEQRETVMDTIRQILTTAGWIEIDEWGCRK